MLDNLVDNARHKCAAGAATRIVVTGGGDCHLGAMMTNELGSLVEHSDDAEDANLLGGYIALKLKAQR